jgi:hypothetical protein
MRPAGNTFRKALLRSGGAGGHSNLRFCLFISLVAFSASAYAQNPHGAFVCRQYSVWAATDPFTNVATMHLARDGSYSAKDLTAHTPDVHGKFVYDAKAKIVTWDSGIWATLLGHYVPNVSGTSLLLVTTKKDPDGKINGTLRCLRVDPKLLK